MATEGAKSQKFQPGVVGLASLWLVYTYIPTPVGIPTPNEGTVPMARTLKKVQLNMGDFDSLPSLERHKSRRLSRHVSTQRTCGKRRLSREQAKDAIRKARFMRERAEAEGGVLHRNESRSYLCPVCPGKTWHLTSQPLRSELAEVA
jgi:hypothetical protein